MLKLFLIRHGETAANQEGCYQGSTDNPLSHVGREQAKSVKETLSGIDFAKVFATDLKRSQETAQIISGWAPEKINIIPQLRERHFGIWENMSYKKIKADYPDLYRSWLDQPHLTVIPEAETNQAIETRVKDGLKLLSGHYDHTEDQNYLLVGHGGINRVILMHYTGMPASSLWKIKQDNCCINIIEISREHQAVSLVNWTKEIYQTKNYRY